MDKRTELLEIATRYARAFGNDDDYRQVAALAAIEAADSYQDGIATPLRVYGSLQIWNRLIDEYRSRHRHATVSLWTEDAGTTLGEIEDAIACLPDDLREIAELMADGADTPRIIKQLGVSSRTVRRIKARLKAYLKGSV